MKKVSIILFFNDRLGYSLPDFNSTLRSLIGQNYTNWELFILNCEGINLPDEVSAEHENIRYISDKFKNRAQALNHVIRKSAGDYILLVNNIGSLITFRLSTLELFIMVAGRADDIGMVYSDYCLINENGGEETIYLLPPHAGRVRDNMDFGAMQLFSRAAVEDVGYLDENYEAADLYDLRLKISSRYRWVHINAAASGYAYISRTTAKSHNVFDYLIAEKNVQREMEEALTSHLKHIDAYLAPGEHYSEISYTDDEEIKFEQCIASVVIPVFNRKEFIGTAIESIQAQTVQNVEAIIVCNGGVDDPTIEGIKPYLKGGEKYDPAKPEVRMFVEDVNNIGFCLNKGIENARGKYYVQLDSDDRLKPDAIEKIIEVFKSDKRIGMVIGSYEVWQQDDKTGEITRMEEIPVVTHDEWTEDNGRNNLLRINGAGAPRSAHIKVIQELGGFGMNDSAYSRNYGEDYDLVVRVSEKYRIGRVWEPIYDVIRHAGGTDHSIDKATIERNDNAKDLIRAEAISRRQKLNRTDVIKEDKKDEIANVNIV
jgi:glycosyltransferase involved in cell wall biosynthesis